MSGIKPEYMSPEIRAQWMAARVKHGGYSGGLESTEHAIWRTMLSRCGNKNSKDFKRYGARGITVCKRGLKFENFLANMGNRPKDRTLERRDNNAGYTPENCYWATSDEQQRNKRSIVWLEHNGITATQTEWVAKLGISTSLACWRMRRWGTLEKGKIWLRLKEL